MTNGNEIPRYEPTPEQLQQLFDRQAEQVDAERASREHLAAWPVVGPQVLKALADRVVALEERVAALTPAAG